MFVWKSVKLHPDDDGHIGDTVLSVEAVPAGVANKVVARYLKQMIFFIERRTINMENLQESFESLSSPLG